MTTTINADNGVSSGSAGLKSSADSSGVLALQTNGTTAVTVDTSQNVGIGTASPSFPSGTGLAIYNSSVPRIKLTNSTTGDASTDGTQLLVSGSDFYIQQREAASVFISTNGTNAVTVDSGGGFKVLNTIGVGNATPSTSGAGITFPATQSASTDANTLDDYEEGTWTPTVVQSGATFTYTYQIARYTKVGNAVTITATLGWNAKSGGSGQVGIAGLPFASINVASIYQQIVCGDFYGFTFPSSSYTNMTTEIVTNTTTGNFVATGSAVSGSGVSSIGSTGLVFLQCTYLTN
jgi:hypothetical protein